MHQNDIVDRLVAGRTEVARHLDLFEDAEVVMNQVGYLLLDGVLSEDASAYVFHNLNDLAESGEPLVRNVLEVLVSNPKGVTKARTALTGPARGMFETLVAEWPLRRH
jgi:hypothetical protein